MKQCEYYYLILRNVSGPGELSRYKDTPTCALTESICKFAGDCTKCDIKDNIHVKRYAKPYKGNWYTVAKYGGYDDSPDVDYYCGKCHKPVREADCYCRYCGNKLI